MKTAIATINTVEGIMTVYYNGENENLTGENESKTEAIEYKPTSYEDAVDAVSLMYGTPGWDLTWVEE